MARHSRSGGALPLFQKRYTAFLHANVRGDLRHATWLAAPRFHRWHHDDNDGRGRNFAGLLPILDRVVGTHELPDGEPAASAPTSRCRADT